MRQSIEKVLKEMTQGIRSFPISKQDRWLLDEDQQPCVDEVQPKVKGTQHTGGVWEVQNVRVATARKDGEMLKFTRNSLETSEVSV